MTELSIIIVSANGVDALCACLASIFRDPPPFPFEVLVVDNASSDGGPERLRREFPTARLILNRDNIGFAAACNRGAAAASGRCLLFLNPDTIVHAGALGSALAFMAQHPRAGIMGCRTLNHDGSLQNTARSFPSLARVFVQLSGLSRRFRRLRLPARELGRPDYVQGSFLVIARSLFTSLGGFEERFFLFGEEVDLCLRARQAGWDVAYDPTTVITHFGGSGRPDSRRSAWFIASIRLLYARHRGALAARALEGVVRLALGFRFLAAGLLLPGEALEWQELRRLSRTAAPSGEGSR
jgi:GT2 family glycosyltransferase